MNLRPIPGNADARRFVCPWCGDHFSLRGQLDAHWRESPMCRANRGVNNPTQSKAHTVLGENGEPMVTLPQPGANVLKLVRERETGKE